MTETAQSVALRALAQRIADTMPAAVEEAILAGSVSRGVADDLSDIEMLLVTREEPDLDDCFSLAAAAGLESLGSWGAQGTPTKRVSGRLDGVPIELIWWSRAHAAAAIDAVFAGEVAGTADAMANGVALRTSGLHAEWLERLRHYPDELAEAEIESAALKWGGFAAAGLLTVLRPGERLALLEWLVDDADRIVRIAFAVNRVWPPTAKRLAARIAELPRTPNRLAARIEDALTEPDARRALLALIDLELETLALASDGPNVGRARAWLAEGRSIVAQAGASGPRSTISS